jgi:hypothetical protein
MVLINLGLYHILKGMGKPRVKEDSGEWVPPEVRSDPTMVSNEPRGAVRRRERRRKVEVEADVDPAF